MAGTVLGWAVAMNKASMVPVGWSQEIPPPKELTLCIQGKPERHGDEQANTQIYDNCIFCYECLPGQ